MKKQNKINDSTKSFQKIITSTENKVENSFINFCESNYENSLQNKTGLLVIDGFVNPKRAYKSLSKKQINSAFILCKIQKVIERLFINQFGVPVIIQRIIGGDVFIEGDLMIGENVRIFNKFPIGDAKVITNFMSVYNFEDFVTLSFFGEDDGTIFVSDGDETLVMKDFFNIVKKANINPRSVETYRMLCSLVQLRFNCKKHERVMKKEMRNFD